MGKCTTCPDCGVENGNLHRESCDVERCPDCGGQMLSCDCEGDIQMPRILWDGNWPGVIECQEFGWYSKMVPGRGWVECEKNDRGASENLNKLVMETVWDKGKARFVLAS